MRPQLKPALRRVWRDRETLQIGLDPERALVVTGLEAPLGEIMGDLTGTRTEEAVVNQALAHGVSGPTTRRLLRLLADAGALDDAESAASALRDLGPAERDRLRPDLAACSVADGSLDGGAATLAGRRGARVAIHGAGRVGASVATLVASAGVGWVGIVDATPARPADLAPAGLAGGDVGVPRGVGAGRAATAAAPSTAVEVVGERHLVARPHVAVLAPDDEPDRQIADMLVRAGVPHLVVRMREARSILGPFVIPGESSCLRCHDLHRTARDPQWPRVLAQILAEPAAAPACDVVLATNVAAQAALHVLAFLKGTHPPSVDATLETELPVGAQRRRTWAVHPACGCQWDPEPAPPPAAAA